MFSSRFMLFPTFKKKNCVKHENLQFSLVNTITHEIIIALGPNLYHGCISGVSWLSSKMDDLDFFQVVGVYLKWRFALFACKHDNLTDISRMGPNLYCGCISGVTWLSSKMDDLDLFFEVMGVCKHDNSINISRIGPKFIPWMYLRSVLVKFEDGWPWPIFQGHDVNCL